MNFKEFHKAEQSIKKLLIEKDKEDKFKKEMIMTIAKYHPYSPKEIEEVYNNTKSWDKTIYCLEKALQLGIVPLELI